MKGLYDYDTPTRSCWATVDDFGDLVPVNASAYFHLLEDEWHL